MSDPIGYRWQFCRGEDDITTDFYAEADADMVRAWEGEDGDFCLIEATKTDAGWHATGGDGSWTVVDGYFPGYADVLEEYGRIHGLEFAEID